MNPLNLLLAAGLGYLCGSFSFARLIARLVAPRKDITVTKLDIKGSDEKFDMATISATTVSMHLGARYGFITAVLYMLKLVVPVLATRLLLPGENVFLITALAGMIGHVWPVYYGFKGGRGLTAVYGTLFAFDPLGAIVTFFGGIGLGIFVIRDLFAAYFAGLWLIIPWLWFRTNDPAFLAYGVAVNLVFAVSLIPEIRKYLELRRKGQTADVSEAMQMMGLGRGIYRIAKRFGVLKEAK